MASTWTGPTPNEQAGETPTDSENPAASATAPKDKRDLADGPGDEGPIDDIDLAGAGAAPIGG
jgi:hypothetical protein